MNFGPVRVKKGGLVVNGKDVTWDNPERPEVVNGHLIIYRRRSWFFKTVEVPLAQIPDYMALLEMVQMRDDRLCDPRPDRDRRLRAAGDARPAVMNYAVCRRVSAPRHGRW